MGTLQNVRITQEVDVVGVVYAHFILKETKLYPGIRSKEELGQIIGNLRENEIITEENAKHLCDISQSFCILTNASESTYYKPKEKVNSIVRNFKIKSSLLHLN